MLYAVGIPTTSYNYTIYGRYTITVNVTVYRQPVHSLLLLTNKQTNVVNPPEFC